MAKENYNWWTDPKNKETVERISWWEHSENKTFIEIPISIIEVEGNWTIGSNKDTEALLGRDLSNICASGETKEEAIAMFFKLMKSITSFHHTRMLKYQKFVPFRKGDWKHTGGKWFTVFGIDVYFRYGKGMKGGWYIPFTKLNIRVYNEWKLPITD